MRNLIKILQRLSRCSSGSAMLEASIIMPLVMSLMAGSVDFGLIVSSQATAKKSVRDAARYLATVPPTAVCTWGLANAQNLAVYGKIKPNSGVDAPLITGWSANGGSNNNVQLGPETDCANPIVIQLQASVPYNSIFLSTILPNVTSWALSAEHEERYVGG
jgi:Flp pilus assembly protein TadG